MHLRGAQSTMPIATLLAHFWQYAWRNEMLDALGATAKRPRANWTCHSISPKTRRRPRSLSSRALRPCAPPYLPPSARLKALRSAAHAALARSRYHMPSMELHHFELHGLLALALLVEPWAIAFCFNRALAFLEGRLLAGLAKWLRSPST